MDRLDAHSGDLVRRLAPHSALVQHVKPTPEDIVAPALSAEKHVGSDVQGRGEGERLIYGLDPDLSSILRLAEIDGLVVDPDFSHVWNFGAGQALDQDRLTRTVVADDREDFSAVDVDVDTVERDDRSERLHEPRAESTGIVLFPPPAVSWRSRSLLAFTPRIH